MSASLVGRCKVPLLVKEGPGDVARRAARRHPAPLLRKERARASGINSASAVLVFGCVAAVCLPSCALLNPSRPLASSVQELVPHADSDHFVFVWQRTASGQPVGNGIQVEHVTAIEGGDFEITLSENSIGVGRVRIRDVGKAIVLLSEDDLTRGVRLQYDPPLPYLEGPVVAGEQRATSEATITTLQDGSPVGALRVAQVIHVRPAGSVHSPLGTFDHVVSVDTARTLIGPGGDLEMRTAMLLVPGVGEIRSDGSVPGEPALHRELACALVSGRAIGDCRHVKQSLQELERAGPSDVQ